MPAGAYQQVEQQVTRAMPAVSAPPDFRASLASNLELLAQHRRSGVIIKPHTAPRLRLALAVSFVAATLATTAVLLAVLLTRSNARNAAGAS